MAKKSNTYGELIAALEELDYAPDPSHSATTHVTFRRTATMLPIILPILNPSAELREIQVLAARHTVVENENEAAGERFDDLLRTRTPRDRQPAAAVSPAVR